MMSGREKQQGFTVLELLVALTLFSFLGMGAHMLLGSVKKNSIDVKARSERLLELQKTVQIIERDIAQAKPSSIIIDNNGHSISFSRKETNASEISAVSYWMENGALKRSYGGILQTLSTDIQTITAQKILPNLIDIELNSIAFGQLNRLLEIPDA